MNINQHQRDAGDKHWPDECEVCIERDFGTCSDCRCGKCCESLLIEASLRDAAREPRIQECGPLYDDNLGQGPRELIGYLLNDRDNHMACRFFDHETRLCTIYATRPLVCRVFDCDVEGQNKFGGDR